MKLRIATVIVFAVLAYGSTFNDLRAEPPQQPRQVLKDALPVGPDRPDVPEALGPMDRVITPTVVSGFDSQAALRTLYPPLDLGSAAVSPAERPIIAALDAANVDKAETALKRLRLEVGQTEAVGVLTGMVRAKRGDLEGAGVVLAATLNAFPNSVSTKLNLSRVLLRMRQIPAATALMAGLVGKQPANLPLVNEYLLLLILNRDLPRAIAVLEAAHEADPAQAAFTSMLADAYTVNKAPGRALALLDGAKVDGVLPPLLEAPMARAQVAAGNISEAVKTYDYILTATPGDLVVRNALFDLLMTNHQPDLAKATLRDALAVDPQNFRVMTMLVATEAATVSVDSAMVLAADIRNNPANAPAAAFLAGDQLMRAKRPLDAAVAYQVEYRAKPSSAMLLRMANAFVTAGQEDMAADDLRLWLKDHADSQEAAAMLAQLDIRAKRWEDAKTHLALILDKNPKNGSALNNLAWVYAMTNDKRGRATALKAYLIAPTADAADTLGWIIAQDDAKAAIPVLRQASAERPTDPEILYHLAFALKNDGQTSEALGILKPIVSGNKAFEEQPAAKAMFNTLSR